MKCSHVLDHLPPNKKDYEPHINPDTYEGEFFQETRLSKKCFKNRYTSPQNIEVDSDSESGIIREEEQEEPKQEEVTAADDLSMLDRLRQCGLPHVDAAEPYEHVIDDSDDDDYAFIDDSDRDYQQFVSGIQFFYVVLDDDTLK